MSLNLVKLGITIWIVIIVIVYYQYSPSSNSNEELLFKRYANYREFTIMEERIILCGMSHPLQWKDKNMINRLLNDIYVIIGFEINGMMELQRDIWNGPYHMIDVKDFSAPTLSQYQEFLDLLSSYLDMSNSQQVRKIGLHCRAGRGRTGTFLAASIMAMEMKTLKKLTSQSGTNQLVITQDERNGILVPWIVGHVIQQVRAKDWNPGVIEDASIETRAQVESLIKLYDYLNDDHVNDHVNRK